MISEYRGKGRRARREQGSDSLGEYSVSGGKAATARKVTRREGRGSGIGREGTAKRRRVRF